jgi:hypothetical protein
MLTLEASDSTQSARFNQYISYFEQKNRAGYLIMRSYVIYVVVPSKARDFYSEIGDDKLLLVFQDPNTPKQESAVVASIDNLRRPDASPSADFQGAEDIDPRLRRTLN